MDSPDIDRRRRWYRDFGIGVLFQSPFALLANRRAAQRVWRCHVVWADLRFRNRTDGANAGASRIGALRFS